MAQSIVFYKLMEVFIKDLQLKNWKKTLIALLAIILLVLCVNIFKLEPKIATLLILALTCIEFIVEWIPIAYVALFTPIELYICGCVNLTTAFSGFSNDNVILFVGMFIVGGSIFRTGAADVVGRWVISKAKGNDNKIMISILVITAIFSSVMSNTGCVAVLMPVCVGIADAAKMDRKRVLLPLALMASLGGMTTMVGTPPNITINSIFKESGLGQFGFFEYAYVGLPLAILGGIYLFFVYSKGKKSYKQENFEIEVPKLNAKQLSSMIVIVLVVIVMATGVIELSVASTVAAIICIATGLISGKEALEDIDWKTVFLFAGMLPMSNALTSTGAGKMIADFSIVLMGGNPSQIASISVLFIIAALLTQCMSNTASCALLAPIALQISNALSASPAGVLMAVGIASSCAFLTPMATPPNTLVYGSSGATFKDYVKIGAPLIVLGYLACIIIIPIVWPFY